MPIRRYLYLCITSFAYFCGHSQIPLSSLASSQLYIVSRLNAGGDVLLEQIEEEQSSNITAKRQMTVADRHFVTYTTRGKTVGEYQRKEQTDGKKISHWVNDTIWHEFDRDKKSQTGWLCGKQGKINRILVEQRGGLPAVEQFRLEKDSSCFVTYRSELETIELEASGRKQRRLLVGRMFAEMAKDRRAGQPLSERLSKQFEPGDHLQLLFCRYTPDDQAAFLTKRRQSVIDYEVISVDSTQVTYAGWQTDLNTGTREILGQKIMHLFDDAVLIGSEAIVADTGFVNRLSIFPAGRDAKPHPFLPLNDITGPSIESYWMESDSLHGTSISYNCYWSSLYPGRLCWSPLFPVLWQDNGESERSQISYIKKSSQVVGELITPTIGLQTRIKEISLQNGQLEITISSPTAETLLLSVYSAENQSIVLDESKLDVKPGDTSFSFILAGIDAEKEIAVKLGRSGKTIELIQEYRLFSRVSR